VPKILPRAFWAQAFICLNEMRTFPADPKIKLPAKQHLPGRLFVVSPKK